MTPFDKEYVKARLRQAVSAAFQPDIIYILYYSTGENK